MGKTKCKHCGSTRYIKYGVYEEYGKRYQNYKCKDCRRQFREVIPMSPTTPPEPQPKPQLNAVKGITKEQLRMKYDNKFIIQKFVETIEQDVFYPENEFIKRAGIRASAGYRIYLEDDAFNKYRGRAPGGVVYWGNPESISEMKNEGILT